MFIILSTPILLFLNISYDKYIKLIFSLEKQGGRMESTLTDEYLGQMAPWFWGIIILTIIILYLYTAIVTQALAKKLNHPKPWMAWIPIANIVQLWQISGTPQWTLICYFISIGVAAIPILGGFLAIGASVIGVYWYWTICEKLHRPNWWSIFAAICLPVWLVMMGIMAWSDTPAAPIAPAPTPTPQA